MAPRSAMTLSFRISGKRWLLVRVWARTRTGTNGWSVPSSQRAATVPVRWRRRLDFPAPGPPMTSAHRFRSRASLMLSDCSGLQPPTEIHALLLGLHAVLPAPRRPAGQVPGANKRWPVTVRSAELASRGVRQMPVSLLLDSHEVWSAYGRSVMMAAAAETATQWSQPHSIHATQSAAVGCAATAVTGTSVSAELPSGP